MDIIELVRKACLRRGFSKRTVETYCFCIKRFFERCKKEPRSISKKDIIDYLDLLVERNLAGSTLNLNLNSLKFLLSDVLNKRFLIEARYSKRPKHLPIFLKKEEVIKLIDSAENEKHKLMLELMYSAGLRLNELINLKAKDFEFDKKYGWVRKGKGNKDRAFIIAEKINEKLKKYIDKNNIIYDDYIFSGRFGHITGSSVQKIVKDCGKKAGIKKNVHPHILRHSFATHLIEDGYDLFSVQSLLGHSSSETTRTYVHMASPMMINVISPFDRL